MSDNSEIIRSFIMSGLFLKKIKTEILLDAAIAAQKFEIAMMLCVLLNGKWESLIDIDKKATGEQLRCLIQRKPELGLGICENELENELQGNAWESLDSL